MTNLFVGTEEDRLYPPWVFASDVTIARMFEHQVTLSQLRNMRYSADDDGPRHYYQGRCGNVVYRPADVEEWLRPSIPAGELCRAGLRERGWDVHPDAMPAVEAWFDDPLGCRRPKYFAHVEATAGVPRYSDEVSLTSRRRRKGRTL